MGPCPEALIDLGRDLAVEAAEIAKRYFRRPVTIDTKPDDSPVTVADRTIERHIRDRLSDRRPTDGVIGEEYGSHQTEAEFVWVIDPIDGTRAFITGRPTFGTLIACLHGDTPVLGLISQPVVGDLWIGAAGRPTTHNGTPVRVRSCPRPADARLATTTPDSMTTAEAAAFAGLADRVLDTLYGGDCYNYGLVASGFLDIALDCSMQLYDFAALVPVVDGAGGRMTDWTGAPLTRQSGPRVLAVGDPALLAPLLDDHLGRA